MALLTEREEIKKLICENCAHFYQLGWVSGTGGGMSVKDGATALVAPSGVEKEKLKPDDIFEISMQGEIVERAKNPRLKLSACTPLFLSIYKLRNAGAVIHSHSLNAFLASKIAIKKFTCNSVECLNLKKKLSDKDNTAIAEIIVTKMEMLKGIKGRKYEHVHHIPVIKNTENECDLADTLSAAIAAYPKAYAVVVENHGVYVWGDNMKQAKTHAECYDYIFKAYVEMYKLGLEI